VVFAGGSAGGQHYYELDDPAAALAALEHDMAALMTEVVAEVRQGCKSVVPLTAPPMLDSSTMHAPALMHVQCAQAKDQFMGQLVGCACAGC
jgi:hypothetical protein